ncbi:MAG: VWA domain-containing protein [Bacteroidia bacterium]|nr:VWA domain-containing protein [Bacteroidia bacterium]
MKMKFLLVAILLASLSLPVWGQKGFSTSSVHQNSSLAIASPDQVVVKEYLNYHDHNIPRPRRGAPLRLSMDHYRVDTEKLILQVGIATKEEHGQNSRKPVNVCLVIDKSGSMHYENRMGKVKAAIQSFVKGLGPEDFISVVAYDGSALAIVSGMNARNADWIVGIVNNIQPGGSTNIHGGLMLGYKVVMKNYSPDFSNKLILLTDGLATSGITVESEIVRASESYNREGIDISTIGVGNNLNHSLLKQLADKGRGANHFIGDAESDMIKVFEQELQSLIAPVGKEVSLEIEIPFGYVLRDIYGYEYSFVAKNTVKVPLKNINQGLTQVIQCELQAIRPTLRGSTVSYSQLTYRSTDDFKVNKVRTEHPFSKAIFSNPEVPKSYHIAQMALALKQMATQVAENQPERAAVGLEIAIAQAKEDLIERWDADLMRVEQILNKELKKIERFNATAKY